MAHLIDRELARMHLPLNGVDAVSASVACLANGLGMSVAPNIAVKECAALLATAPLAGQIFAVRSESWIAQGGLGHPGSLTCTAASLEAVRIMGLG
jgi:DNA-binding transcriptional LysR family regulator